METTDVRLFSDKLNLNNVSEVFIDSLEEELNKLFNKYNVDTYIVGYHLRHVFDTQSPFVAVRTHNGKDIKDKADKIKLENEKKGLHTINHVLDSLFYPYLYQEEEKPNNNLLALQFDFNNDSIDGEFNISKNIVDNNEFNDIINEYFNGYISKIENFDGNKDLVSHYNRTGSVNLDIEKLYSHCIYGIHLLLDRLNIPPSIVHYKSIASALYQMMFYFEDFGEFVTTLIIRPKDSFKFAIGISIFTDTKFPISELKGILQKTSEHHNLLNEFSEQEINKHLNVDSNSQYYKQYNSIYTVIKKFKRFQKLTYDATSYNVNDEILDSMVSLSNLGLAQNDIILLKQTIQSFLKVSINFLHQKNEGKPLKYGLLLGNPFLIKYWKGSFPVPCSQLDQSSPKNIDSNTFFDLQDLPHQFHLVSNPEERIVVIPYLSEIISKNEPLPAFIIELSDFLETFSSVKESILWIPEHRPYFYLTKRFPWAYAVIAGPDSELRVFSKGKILAYRDGKGWKLYDNPFIKEGIIQAINTPQRKTILSTLLDVSVQLSPYIRNNAKGGFLIFFPLDKDSENWEEIIVKNFETLFDNEPTRWNGYKWLTDRDIMNEDTGKEDLDILPLLVQAGSLDGATIIGGDKGTIKLIGQRSNIPHLETTINTNGNYKTRKGSKRAAAYNIVKWAHSEEMITKLEGTFAITISSDGPINLYYYNQEVKIHKVFKEL